MSLNRIHTEKKHMKYLEEKEQKSDDGLNDFVPSSSDDIAGTSTMESREVVTDQALDQAYNSGYDEGYRSAYREIAMKIGIGDYVHSDDIPQDAQFVQTDRDIWEYADMYPTVYNELEIGAEDVTGVMDNGDEWWATISSRPHEIGDHWMYMGKRSFDGMVETGLGEGVMSLNDAYDGFMQLATSISNEGLMGNTQGLADALASLLEYAEYPVDETVSLIIDIASGEVPFEEDLEIVAELMAYSDENKDDLLSIR